MTLCNVPIDGPERAQDTGDDSMAEATGRHGHRAVESIGATDPNERSGSTACSGSVEAAGPALDRITLTRSEAVPDVRLRLDPELHGRLSSMFAEYGISSLEEGVLRALGLWRYLDRVSEQGGRLVVIDPQRPQGPFDVIDLHSW